MAVHDQQSSERSQAFHFLQKKLQISSFAVFGAQDRSDRNPLNLIE